MSDETDCEIEYLEEDEDIVQQCVQIPPPTNVHKNDFENVSNKGTPLLVERKAPRKEHSSATDRSYKRKRKTNSDSDYDPTEDMTVLHEDAIEEIKGKIKGKSATKITSKTSQLPPVKTSKRSQKQGTSDIKFRKEFDIRIPDYEDPLCLPVKAIQRDLNEIKKLRNWNNMCFDYLKHCDHILKPEKGPAVSSKRIFVLRNVKNKFTGRVDTTVWSKTTAQTTDGEKKSQVFQCILPKFRENKLVNHYKLPNTKNKTSFSQVNEVILTKEVHKDGQSLVAYKPKEALSAVYKFLDPHTISRDDLNVAQLQKRLMKEVTACKCCAPCYQMSWRGFTKSDNKTIRCQICNSTYVSVYNLLAHLKSHHTNGDVRKHRQFISKALASVMNYHYKCRICQNEFLSIKELRKHVRQHNSTEPFICEIGNHTVTS